MKIEVRYKESLNPQTRELERNLDCQQTESGDLCLGHMIEGRIEISP